MNSKKIYRRLPRDEKGSAAVEFALGALVFFTVLFAIIEFGMLFWVNLTMQHAVREGARYAITGDKSKDPTPTQVPDGDPVRDRNRAVIQMIKESSMGLYDKACSSNPPDNFGTAGEILVLRLECTWPIMTPFIRNLYEKSEYKFSVSSTMRNEAFSP